MKWQYIVLFLAFGYFFLKYPNFRILILNPFKDVFYFFRDAYFYIAHKEYNNCQTGEMVAFTGLFGKGKTLSAVHYVMNLYRTFNNRQVWDKELNDFVTQKVHIISNVQLLQVDNFEYLENLSQIVQEAKINKDFDRENHTRTILLVLIDEASVQLNSRSFKNNINADFLNTLLTSRHYHMSMFYTSQRFNLTDKLLRDVTQQVIDCNKFWRLQGQKVYDAYELENAGNPENVAPIRKTGFFVRNRDYEAYDTLAVVDRLNKSFTENDFVSDTEILMLRNPNYADSGTADELKGFKKILHNMRT